MSALATEFRELRRVSTPWCIVQTSDFRATTRTLLDVRRNGEEPPPAVLWDCCNGPQNLRGRLPALGTADDPPARILSAALSLPAETLLFFVVPDIMGEPGSTWTNPFTTQAVANLRDEFKANRRTLVILSTDGKLPALIADDVPRLEDPLPTKEEIRAIGEKLRDDNKANVPDADLDKAAAVCQGMNRFAAEEAISRKLRKTGIDLPGLAAAQRTVIEQSSERGLTFERGSETFEDIGGLNQVKQFSSRLFSGKRPPSVIVRIEEIEKAMAGSGSGQGDTSGVSQDQLGVLLTCMEDNDWTGLIAVGPAGSGKSLLSKAMGNTNNVPTVNLDLGALKGQYVGQSEGKIRKAMQILKSFAGNGAFFVATSNGIDVIKPELRRRFRFGVWYFDLPTTTERKAIWGINLKRFGIDETQTLPIDSDWTGSDIRNVCDLASRLSCPLTEAATYIVPVAQSDPGAVSRLREAANGKYLSASAPGAYTRPEAKGQGRTLTL